MLMVIGCSGGAGAGSGCGRISVKMLDE